MLNDSSEARIVDAYLEPFEALSTQGVLTVYVENIGHLTSAFTVTVGDCSGGIDYIDPELVTLDPGEERNLTFVIHSYHAIGQLSHCLSKC